MMITPKLLKLLFLPKILYFSIKVKRIPKEVAEKQTRFYLADH